jgi:hypothetical protein
LYFGIGCERSHSASEIAREFQVSSQVIGGILAGAQRRLAKVGLTLTSSARRAHADFSTRATNSAKKVFSRKRKAFCLSHLHKLQCIGAASPEPKG